MFGEMFAFCRAKKSSLQAHSWLGRNGLTVQAGPSGGVPACEPHIERGPWRYGPMGPMANGLSRFIMVHDFMM